MKISQLTLSLIMVFSWTCATLFTNGIDNIVNGYVSKYHHRSFIYFASSMLFLVAIVYLSHNNS